MKFTYPPLGRIFENQAKKQVDTLKSFNLSNKINEFNEIKLYFHKIKQIIQFLIAEKESHNYKNDTKLNELYYKAKSRNVMI